MKVNFKQLSKKTLSCILALAVILCSVTVMFSAFAETEPEAAEPYTISYRSPAIPMFVGKQVLLTDLEVDFSEDDGDTYPADKVIWKHVEGESAQILGGGFYAQKTGMTKFTATYGGKVQTVYVIVNEAGDYDFELVNLDLTKTGEGGYVASDWVASNATSFTANDLAISENTITQNPYGIRGTWTRGTLLYNNDILKDFADYTYQASIRHTQTSGTDGPISVTFITRAQHNTTVGEPLFVGGNTSGNALGIQFALYGGPSIVNVAKGTRDLYENAEHFYWTPSLFHTLPFENFDYGTTETSYALSQNHNFSVKVDGDDLVVKVAEGNADYTVVLDTNAETVHRSVLNTGKRQAGKHFPTDLFVEERDDVKGSDVSNIVANTTLQAGTIGFGTSYTDNIHLKTARVLLNIDKNSVMPNLQAPSFYAVRPASPAIPMFAGKQAALSDIVLEIDGELVFAADEGVTWTAVSGSNAAVLGDVLYAAEVGTTKFTVSYGEATQVVYVIVNEENDYDFYIVNEVLNAANYVDNEWIFANSAFSVPAAGYTVLDPGYTMGDYEDKTANGGVTGLDTSGVQKETGKIGVGYKEHGMLIYKSEMLKDFADYTAEFSYMSNGVSWEQQATFILRADVDYNVAVGETIFPNYKTGGKYNALALQFKQFGAPSLRNMTDPFNVVQAQWEKIGYHTVDNFAKIQYSTHGNYNPLYVLGAGNSRTGTVTVKASGNDVLAKINGNTVLDTTEETIKTVTYTTNAAWADDIIVEGESITSAAFKETIATKTNTGAGTVGLLVSRSDSHAFGFTSLTVKLNNTKEEMPKMQDPTFYTVKDASPAIPMTAGTKLDLGSFLVEADGSSAPAASFTWNFADADASDIKVEDGYVYAYERGTYTATITNGTVTDYIHFVVKNPDETEYVIYEKNFRGDNVDVSEWKTTISIGVKNPTEYTGLSYSGNQMANNTSLIDSGWGALPYNPPGFAPYNMAEVAAALSGSANNEVAIYTTLDNDILADISNYKYTVGLKSYSNHRGAIGVIGRVSNTVDGKYIAGSSAGIGIGTNGAGNFKLSTNLYLDGTFTIVNGAQANVTNAELTRYYFTNNVPCSLAYRSFEIEYSGNTATYTIPNGESQTISIPAGQKGTVGVVGFGFNTTANSAGYGLPILMDAKVVLSNVNTDGLEFEKIDHVPAATPVLEGYTDTDSYSFAFKAPANATSPSLTKETASKKVVFPTEIDGVKPTALSDNLFFGQTYIQNSAYLLGEVVIPEGYKGMGYNVFRDNTFLEYVSFPSTLTYVGNTCFRNTAIVNLSFPEGSVLKSIEPSAFAGVKSLHTLKLPEGLKTICDYAFSDCVALYEFNIPSTVETIGFKAFYKTDVTEVRLPAATTSVGENAFADSARLSKVYVLNANCTFGASAIPATATIYGYTGSTAEEYATANGNEFVPIDDITSNPLPANSAFNLDAVKIKVGDAQVAGANIDWAAHRGSDYELVNGWLMVYAENDIVLTGTYGDQTVTLNIEIAPKGTETGLVVKTFADKNMTIAPVANDATAYTVKINETDREALKYGTLTVTADNCDAVKIANAIGDKGDTFGFKVIKPETMVLAAEYTTLAEREASIYPLGAQVRPATDTYSAGIRFITRFPEIKMEPAGIYLDEAYSQVGVLIIPYVLWDGTTIPDAEALSKSDVPMGKTDKAGNAYTASNVVVSKLMTANEAYADAAALLTGIPSSMYGVDIMALPYLIGTDGEVTYIEGDPMIKSYNDVLDASYPKFNDNIDNILYGGTDHDIDADPATTAISYGLNEDISFIIRLKGDYQIKWSLYKDDPDVNAISELGEVNGSIASHVKSGTFTPGVDGNTLIVTTQMKQAGVVRLVYNLYDANGKAVRVNENGGANNFSMSAAADYKNITQSVEEEGLFTAEQVMTEAKGYYETWKKEWDEQVKVITDAAAADAGFVSWLADNEKTAGAEKQVGELLKLKVAANNGTYTAYYFWIATGEEGLSTAGTENNRPATGVFSIPNTADNSLDMYTTFTAWGGNNVATSGPQSGTLEVRVVGHGKDLGTEFDLNSGNNTEDPTQVFNYGILNRDYVALQVAKSLFANKLKDNFGIKTNGGSMGGWRSVIIGAIDTDVNEFQVNVPWMCQVGAAQAGDITSWHPTYCDGLRPFSTVTAARIINERVAAGEQEFTVTITAGLGDYQASAPHGIIALYNAFDDAKVAKSLTFWQFKEHGNQVYGSFTEFTSSVTNR